MPSFPLICNNERTSDWELFDQVRSRPIVRTPFENGAVQTRTRVTTSRWKFSVGANLMTTTLYDTLTAFFDANQGGAFDFIHPITGVTHEVRFSEDELPGAKPTGTGSNARWSISGIALEETAGSTVVTETTTTSTTSTSSSSSSSSTSSTISSTSSISSTTTTTT